MSGYVLKDRLSLHSKSRKATSLSQSVAIPSVLPRQLQTAQPCWSQTVGTTRQLTDGQRNSAGHRWSAQPGKSRTPQSAQLSRSQPQSAQLSCSLKVGETQQVTDRPHSSAGPEQTQSEQLSRSQIVGTTQQVGNTRSRRNSEGTEGRRSSAGYSHNRRNSAGN